MKKVTYDKSGIMEEAWNLFNNDDITLADFEYFGWMEWKSEKTFAICLKEAWGREKEVVERVNQKFENAETSEEVKAWDWACKKLGVAFEMDAYTKMTNVEGMEKEAWPGTSVWSLAMRAVKLHMEVAA
ncbi:anti-CRISPR protein AcrIIA3 [Streptococcus sp. 517s]